MARRRHQRYPAYDHATLTGVTEPVTGFIANVSQQGVRFLTQTALGIGQGVKLRIAGRVLSGNVVYSNVAGHYFCTGIASAATGSGASTSELLRSILVEPSSVEAVAEPETSIPVRRTVSRHHLRYPASGTLRLLWRADDGGERMSDATITNASRKGVRLRLDERIPVRSHVFLDDEVHGLRGVASVHYCRFANGSYDVGLEFSETSDWAEPGTKL